MVKKVSKKMAAKVKKVATPRRPARLRRDNVAVSSKSIGRLEFQVRPVIEIEASPDLRKDNVMTQAEAIIYGDREKTYGHPSLNLETIAQLWTVYFRRKAVIEKAKFEQQFGELDLNGARLESLIPAVTIDDVCQMMVLMKSARLLNDPSHHDSQVDQIGYIALQERCREGA